jgi:2,3-bisphosphoglycerate-dependent phosphoglycerate mutase
VLIRHGESTWNQENKFTGWYDCPLSEKGHTEAAAAGKLLKEGGFKFDIAYTSYLKRAIRTLWHTLEQTDLMYIPVKHSWELNERHYGDLQGLNKARTAEKYGADQVKIWRRSYDVPPPGIGGESLELTAARTLPFFERCILGDIAQNKNVLVVAHGNSNRSIVMALDKLTKEEVLELNLGTAVPVVYELAETGEVLGKSIL